MPETASQDGQIRVPPIRAARVGLSLLLVVALIAQSSWFFAAMCLMAGAMVVTGVRGSWRDWLVWIGMLAGFALFAELRAAMEADVEARPLFLYVIQMETVGGLLPLPTIWLQDRLQESFLNAGGLLDAVSTATYISFFIVPQVVVVHLWWKGGAFTRYVAAACLLFAGALAVHYLLPTAPPWMAAEEGLLPPLDRIGMEVLTATSSTLTQGGYSAQANDVAAMPSLHQGLAVLAMMAMVRQDSRTLPTALGYSFLMLFAITYLGEHYAVDGLVGAGMAWGAWWVSGRFLPSGSE
jgi:hypothetical protein